MCECVCVYVGECVCVCVCVRNKQGYSCFYGSEILQGHVIHTCPQHFISVGSLVAITLRHRCRGGGTGPADPATAGPMF